MDYEVAWSPEALGDVDAITEYIARDSVFYAQAVVAKIIEASRTLADFPFAGRIVPEFGQDDVRERFIYSYRLIYRIEEARILIVAVIHGKRLLEPAKDRFDS